MTTPPRDPDQPFRGVEYPSLENSLPPSDGYAPIDYPDDAYPPLPPPVYPQYGAPGYLPGYPVSPAYDPYGTAPIQPGTNGKAIGALVTALVGLPFCFACGIPSIVAMVLGVIAMNETKRTGQQGRGLALAAVIIGAGTLVLFVLLVGITMAAEGFTVTSY